MPKPEAETQPAHPRVRDPPSPQPSPKRPKKSTVSADNPQPADPDDVAAVNNPLFSIVCHV